MLGENGRVDPTPFPWLLGSTDPTEVWLDGEMEAGWVLAAYQRGFFPWPIEERLAWWCPLERLVFEAPSPHLSRTTHREFRRRGWSVTLDRATPEVIRACAEARGPERDGTWITPEIQQVYGRLAREGLVHSCEVWEEGTLVGGIYGLSLGSAFFGESMFSARKEASKVAIAVLAAWLQRHEFDLFDGQVENAHLLSLGGVIIPRDAFLTRLASSLEVPTLLGPWSLDADAGELLRQWREQ